MRVYVALAVIALVAGYSAIFLSGGEDLEFAELASPAGFRALVLGGGLSRVDAMLGSLQNTPPAGRGSVQDLCNGLLRDVGSPALSGPVDGITIVEFFDYRCPYCKKLTKIISQLHAERGVRVIYKEWPILGESSKLAARAALAAGKQNRYHEYHSLLMGAGFVPTPAYLEDLGVRLGLDLARWRQDMQSVETSSALGRTAALASTLGLSGTPALVVGHTIVQGAITRDQLEHLIDNEMSMPQAQVC